MSITSRITSMTQHTKEAYDKIASLGADLTGVNKNLDNIADVLDDVYAGYPKVTGSGTSITMANTKKGGMEIEYKGNTSQTGTPTPTSPIDVNVVKGNNILTVSDGTNSTNYPVNLRGKNLFDKNNANIEQGGWISAVGVKGNGDNNKLFKLPIKPSTTYTIQKKAGNRFRAGTYQNGNIANGTSFNVFQQNDSGTSITITSTATDTYLYVQYLAGDTNEQQLLDSIQIEERFYSYYLSVILGI